MKIILLPEFLFFKKKCEGFVILRRRNRRFKRRSRHWRRKRRRKTFKWKSHRIGFISDDVRNKSFFRKQHFNSLSVHWINIIWAMNLRKYIKFHNIWCFICSVYTHCKNHCHFLYDFIQYNWSNTIHFQHSLSMHSIWIHSQVLISFIASYHATEF